MDGYSVQEAASVLGVAEGRVWELLARGVLLGTPEGDSMRVFLKAQPGPISAAGTHDEPPRTNGNGGSQAAAGEASAFRELLTEFRNLTERYGQALLALGEARGEVAGLRSRVDQLEARLDLRLPPPLEAGPVAWESATIPAATPEAPPVTRPSRPVSPRPKPARPKARPRKGRTPREAVAGFADALARAQDPNAADLGPPPDEQAPAADLGSMAAVADLAEPAHELPEPMGDEAPTAEVAEEVAAEPIPVGEIAAEEAAAADMVAADLVVEDVAAEGVAADEAVAEAALEPIEEPAEGNVAESSSEAEAPTYSAVVVEPDWFADGDFAWLDAADMEATAPAAPDEPEPATATDDAASAAPELEAPAAESAEENEPLVGYQAEPSPEQPDDEQGELSAEPEFVQQPESRGEPVLETAAEPESMPVFEADAEFEAWQPPQPTVTEPAEPEVDGRPLDMGSQGGGGSLAETEDRRPADGPEPQTMRSSVAVEQLEEEVMWLGAAPTSIVQDEPRPAPLADPEPWPAVDVPASPPTEVTRPPLAMTEDELARLALDEGWDEAEVAAIRAMITPIPSATVDLPGAAELHEAMAALEAVPVRIDPAYDTSRQWAKPAPEEREPVRQDDWVFEAEPAEPAEPAAPPEATPRSPTDVTSALRRSATDPGWLRRRQGPAAAAYRRLRRLFPG